MGYKIQEVQPTPNPNAMKFVLDSAISDRPVSFLQAEAAKQYPLAQQLFGIPGVSGILFLGDFITINKVPQATWADIRKQANKILADAPTSPFK